VPPAQRLEAAAPGVIGRDPDVLQVEGADLATDDAGYVASALSELVQSQLRDERAGFDRADVIEKAALDDGWMDRNPFSLSSVSLEL